jgi:adenosylcobinamide-phosphate synthase
MTLLPHGWAFALATVGLAGLIDITVGEPPSAVHPVVWMGLLIGALAGRRPSSRPAAEVAYGVLIVVLVAGVCAAAGVALAWLVAWLPWWLALPLGAGALKTTFSLRGLVGAGRRVQRALARPGDSRGDTAAGAATERATAEGGTAEGAPAQRVAAPGAPAAVDAARAGLAALVSRSPDLDPPLIVSATVESLAENLTDSVVSPLLYFALLGLPGAFTYRAINTMDAMLGYRDEREYVGKAAARTDDGANWIPARLAALLLVATARLRGTAADAWWAMRTQHLPQFGPNKTLAIATMAGALGVQLQKPGAYALGRPGRPLTEDVIGDAAVLVWVAGGVTIAAAAGVAALMAWAVWP